MAAMRVIAGTARGRRLTAPRGADTRPTPDRVREALFSLLAPHLPEARVLDLFAGTGALGIEALSRGAGHATFIERDRDALTALRRNLTILPGADVRVLGQPLPRALDPLAEEEPFDLIFLDPPYAAGLLAATLARLSELNLLNHGGVAICEHPGGAQGEASPPETIRSLPSSAWRILETRSWGNVAVTLLGPLARESSPNGGHLSPTRRRRRSAPEPIVTLEN